MTCNGPLQPPSVLRWRWLLLLFAACLFSLQSTERVPPPAAQRCNWRHFQHERREENQSCQKHTPPVVPYHSCSRFLPVAPLKLFFVVFSPLSLLLLALSFHLCCFLAFVTSSYWFCSLALFFCFFIEFPLLSGSLFIDTNLTWAVLPKHLNTFHVFSNFHWHQTF